jgi:hypothetical protein
LESSETQREEWEGEAQLETKLSYLETEEANARPFFPLLSRQTWARQFPGGELHKTCAGARPKQRGRLCKTWRHGGATGLRRDVAKDLDHVDHFCDIPFGNGTSDT